MLAVAVVLFLVCAAGIAALGAKYAFGPAPADYHAEILRRGGAEIHAEVARVIGALNAALGAGFGGLSALMAATAVFGVAADLLWAKTALLASVLIVGLPTLAVTRRVQAATGATTPVRPTIALLAVGVVAFLLSLAGGGA